MQVTSLSGKTAGAIEFSAVAIPRPGIGLEQAKDLWLGANPQNKVLDFGDNRDPRLLVAHDKTKTVIYEVCLDACPPGFTVEMAMRDMKKAGWDVRGQGPNSPAGNPTVVVAERSV